jgi:hypothetical protein
MEEKMSRWGIGPVFAALSIGYGMITLLISRHLFPFAVWNDEMKHMPVFRRRRRKLPMNSA